MTESVWVGADALAPLVFRGGRSFGASGESGANVSVDFPRPGTVAGALRAAIADVLKLDMADAHSHARLIRDVSIRGPFLASSLVGDANPQRVYLPKPADSLYVAVSSYGTERCEVRALQPAPQLRDAARMPFGLLPLALIDGSDKLAAPQKPLNGPAFWSAETLREWLVFGEVSKSPELDTVGVGDDFAKGPTRSLRTHVKIQAASRAGHDEHLFQTSGLDFSSPRGAAAWANSRWVLVAHIESRLSDSEVALAKGLDRLDYRMGADGRGVTLRVLPTPPPTGGSFAARTSDDPFATAFDSDYGNSVVEAVLADKQFRLVLITPGLFSGGAFPAWLQSSSEGCLEGELPGTGCRVRLLAASVERWEPYSGWSMETRQAKAVRRVVPAGATYWFKTLSVADPKTAEKAIRTWRGRPCSGEDLIDRDGWGLSLLGCVARKEQGE